MALATAAARRGRRQRDPSTADMTRLTGTGHADECAAGARHAHGLALSPSMPATARKLPLTRLVVMPARQCGAGAVAGGERGDDEVASEVPGFLHSTGGR
jgi:hypothetical protein